MTEYADFFRRATGNDPYPYQERLGTAEPLSGLLSVPTGAGKTEAVILSWLWRRRFAGTAPRLRTPRRLVYCLPMRTLVEQTARVARGVLERVGLETVAWDAGPRGVPGPDAVGLAVVMGGEPRVDWDLFPEADAIVIGTQDMLLSRALNRGYGSSRYRWPLAFALLNNDALWVHDEVQLMGDGLATSTQLAGLRRKLGVYGGSSELWLSATMRRDWLASVDFLEGADEATEHSLDEDDRTRPELTRRLQAAKTLCRQDSLGDEDLAEAVVAEHRAGGMTLVVVNTVARAVEVYRQVVRGVGPQPGERKAAAGGQDLPDVVVVHSRFRPPERRRALDRVLAPCPPAGRIVVATQVVEAGMDISAGTLFTDLAPWASLVQRIGRCNRAGEHPTSRVFVVDRDPEKESAPYSAEELERARAAVAKIGNGGSLAPADLQRIGESEAAELLPYRPEHVLRRRDLLDLFDTTPDIAGNDIDVSRFVRNVRETDAYVFWRHDTEAADACVRAGRDELCPVPVGELRRFAAGVRSRNLPVRVWDHLGGRHAEGAWVPVRAERLRPGEVYLIDAAAGGYSPELGWQQTQGDVVEPLGEPPEAAQAAATAEADGMELYVEVGWQTLAEHTDLVVAEVQRLLAALSEPGVWDLDRERVREALLTAARWHDRGKAHQVFQAAITVDDRPDRSVWAKAPAGAFGRYQRYGFRHEVASALAARDAGLEDLVWYLAGAHHGKVRLALRALPDENRLRGDRPLSVRGIQDGDELPETPLGGGVVAPSVRLTLDAVALGRDDAGRPGWTEAVARLRDGWPGPFRLAFLEALLRCADVRASMPVATPTADDVSAVSATGR